MRKNALPVAFGGLLALLAAGIAFSQFGGGGGRDPGASFDRMAKGRGVLSISEAPPFLQERLTQYAQQHGLGSQITRDQYIAFVTEMRSGQGGPKGGAAGGNTGAGGAPGKGPAGGTRGWANNPEMLKFRADREFRQMDANKDGFLDSSEIPAARHDDVFRFDRNGDGLIDPREYLEYVQARAQGQTGGGAGRQQWDVQTITPDDSDQKPTIYRAGKLPKDLPPWFEQYDLNKDGQVSLYEWRMAKEPIDEFLKMDRNDDGLLTAEEVLRYEKLLAKANGQAGPAQTASLSDNPEARMGPRGPGKGGGGRKGRKDRQQAGQ
jgi:Ca2+-binding EF-hand superfamily protein